MASETGQPDQNSMPASPDEEAQLLRVESHPDQDTKALLSAQMSYTRNLKRMQRTFLDLIQRSVEQVQSVALELLGSTAPTELQEAYRQLLKEGMDQLNEGTAKIFLVSIHATDGAIERIEKNIKQADRRLHPEAKP